MVSKKMRVVQVVIILVLLLVLIVVLAVLASGYKSTKVTYNKDKITVYSVSDGDRTNLKNLFTNETLYTVYSTEGGLPNEESYSEVASNKNYTFGITRFEEVKDNAKILTISEYSCGVFSKPMYLTYSVKESTGSLTIEINPLDNNVYDLTSIQDFIDGLLLSYNIE